MSSSLIRPLRAPAVSLHQQSHCTSSLAAPALRPPFASSADSVKLSQSLLPAFCHSIKLAPPTTEVSNEVLVTAFQLRDFIASDHQFATEINARGRQIVQYLTDKRLRPARSIPSTTAASASRDQRHRSRSVSFNELDFPSEWATDRPSFRYAVKAFGHATASLRRLFDPPSTGNTPERPTTPLSDLTPLPSPSAQSTTNRSSAEGFSSRNQSSEEAFPRSSTPTSAEEETRRSKIATMSEAPIFSQAQADQMAAIMANAMRMAGMNQQPTPPPAPPQPTADERRTAQPAFRARDIGYFDPNPDVPAIEVKDHHNVYHNVFSFTNRLRVKVTTMDAAALRQNLDSCLLGAADDWYTNQLTHLSRVGLRNSADGVKEWCDALEARFRDSPGKSLTLLEMIRYTVRDVRNRKDPSDYVSSIVLNSKNAGIAATEPAQVLLAYEHIDGELRRDLSRPTEASTVAALLEELRHQKDIWYDIYSKGYEARSQPSTSTNRTEKGKQPQGQYYNPPRNPFRPSYGFGSYGGSSMPFGNPNSYGNRPATYQNYNNTQQPQQQSPQATQVQQRQLPGGRQQLQITSGRENANTSAGNNPNRPPNAGNRNPFRPYGNPRRPFARAYQYEAYDDDPDKENQPDEMQQYQQYEDAFYQGPSWSEEPTPQAPTEQPAEGFQEPDESVEAHFCSSPTAITCRNCKMTFSSGNQLHKHLESCLRKPTAEEDLPKPSADCFLAAMDQLIQSKAQEANATGGYGFRGYRYATVIVCFEWRGKTHEICIDTGCTMSLIDRNFLKQLIEEGLIVDIQKMPTPMKVRGLGTNQHDASEYARIAIYLPGSEGKGTALITREVHIVDNLSANILIGIDIMKPEGMVLDLGRDTMTIGSCQHLEVPISTRTKDTPTELAIFNQTRKVIAPHTDMRVPVKARRKPLHKLPADRDFIFEPSEQDALLVCAHVVDHTMSEIIVRNESDHPVILPKRTRLGKVVEYEAGGCYVVQPDMQDLAHRPAKATKTSRVKRAFAATMAVTAAFNAATAPKPEITHATGVTMYDSGHDSISALAEAVEAYPSLWNDTGNVTNIPESEWMEIPLVDNWQEQYKPGQARVYPVGAKDRQVIDEAFDKLHEQGRIEWTSTATPFSFPCFVIWKDTPTGPKGRVVVDIRALNKITVPDAYPVPSQAEILALLRDATHISTIDAAAFFYQWWVKRSHRYRLTVATHRGQETFLVPVMGFRNSPAYVQRMIDRILRRFRHFCRAYVDDIVIFSTSLEEHKSHLTQVFQALAEMNIHLAPGKAFLGYPSVRLLGQRVDALGLATAEEKLWAIKNLAFPRTLAALDKYLGLTGYLKQYVPYYTAIAKPLQERKTLLYQKSKSNNGVRHKTTAARLRLEKPTPRELNAYHQLQQIFARPTMLHHHDPKRQLYVDLDASKEWGLAAHVYHVKEDEPLRKPSRKPNAGTHETDTNAVKPTAAHPKQKSLQPILFLSRQLKPAETRYWPTELEMAGIVWVVKKIRHLIEASTSNTIIYTDHSAAIGLVRQTSLNTTSVEKLNLRLIRASEYLQRFRIELRHKPGKTNIVPDALSRLASRDYDTTGSDEAELDALIADAYPVSTIVDAYPVSMIQVSDDFKARVQQGYQEPRWQRIMSTVKRNNELGENAAKLPYVLKDGLLYCKGELGALRLCIPSDLEKEVFKLAHDEMGHPGYARTHEKLTTGLFIYNMATKLHEYIRHCPHCQMNQTPRHRPYGSLQPIYSPSRPFHTITIDFILALPKASTGDDCIMSLTDKFSKAISLIAGEIRWGGELWAQALLDRLLLLGWGIPWAIISDRDRRFIGQLWEEIFRLLKVELLYSTAWHPQTDGMSERSNQTAEIALRYFVEQMGNRWPYSLPQMSAVLNNSTKYSTTRLASSEILFGFKVKEPLDLLGAPSAEAFRNPSASQEGLPSAHLVDYRPTHVDAKDALDFASMKMKEYYDTHHQPIFFNVGDLVKLRLHRGYEVPGVSKKIGQQFVGPFKVLERIGRLAYRIQLPSNMRIHDVVSVAQLEPTTDPASDPYARRPPPPPIVVESGGDMERLLRKRSRYIGRSKTKITEYLVRWVARGPEHDVWMSTKQLTRLAPYLIDAYEASQKEAVVTSAPKEKEQAIAVRIPPRPMLPMPSADPKPVLLPKASEPSQQAIAALPSLPRRAGLRSLQQSKQLLLTQ